MTLFGNSKVATAAERAPRGREGGLGSLTEPQHLLGFNTLLTSSNGGNLFFQKFSISGRYILAYVAREGSEKHTLVSQQWPR